MTSLSSYHPPSPIRLFRSRDEPRGSHEDHASLWITRGIGVRKPGVPRNAPAVLEEDQETDRAEDVQAGIPPARALQGYRVR